MPDLQQWDGIDLEPEKWLVQVTDDFGYGEPCSKRVDFHYNNGQAAYNNEECAFNISDQTIADLCSAYFASFHCTYPVLDPHLVYNQLIPRVCNHSFDENDEGSALVLLILGLGSVAKEAVQGPLIIEPRNGRPTGVRGGTRQVPPGALFLDEARRRMGITLTRFNITTLQSYILLAWVSHPIVIASLIWTP